MGEFLLISIFLTLIPDSPLNLFLTQDFQWSISLLCIQWYQLQVQIILQIPIILKEQEFLSHIPSWSSPNGENFWLTIPRRI